MKTLLFTSVFAAIVLSSCTENTRTKSWGTTTVDLAPNTKIVSATWTGSDLWYLTRPTRIRARILCELGIREITQLIDF